MNLKQLERKLSRFAISDLTLYLVGGQGLALVLGMVAPGLTGAMVLVPGAVAAGEWWRLLSFAFMPPFGNPIFAAFALYLLWFMGGSLESQWGAFRYNVYVLIGLVMTVIAAFAFQLPVATNTYVTGSIFLAFAYLFPDFTMLLFFILPVRVKWLALLTWAFYGYRLAVGDWTERALVLAAVTNFLLFFGADLFYSARQGHRRIRRQAAATATRDEPRHVCAVCAINDKTHPAMDFRYCSKCEPPLAYCTEHLRNHPHVTPGAAGPRP